MPLGTHSFSVNSPLVKSGKNEMVNYYLGSFTGDHWTDKVFDLKIKRVTARLAKIYGWGGFSASWSPVHEKPYKPLTVQQKYQRAITKQQNKHKKEVLSIINDNTLFVDDYLDEATKAHYQRIEVLKERYTQQTKS